MPAKRISATMPAIIITGNPVDGFEFIGPFPSDAEAVEYTSRDRDLEADWWVATLHEPAEVTNDASE